MQEMLVPPPAPKVEAKYTGFMLATEKRAYERLQQEQERQAQIAHILATEGPEAAAAAAAGVAMPKPGTTYDRGTATKSATSGRVSHTGGRRVTGSGVPVSAAAPVIVVAPWRLRMWAARRRVMIIVMTVMRLQRGKRRNRAGNKLDNLGFMIPRVLADDVPRFVEEQRKYAGIKEELEAAKQTMEDMMYRNGSSTGTGALTEEPPWPGIGLPAAPRQPSVATRPPTTPPTGPGAGGLAGVRSNVLSTGRLSGRSRASDSGTLAHSANQHVAAGVSPMRMRTPTASGVPTGGAASGLGAPVVPAGGPPQLGMATGPARLSTNSLAARLGLASGAGSDDSGPGSPAANHGSPKANGGPLNGPLAALMSGLGRRTSTPGGLGMSPPASREGSLTAGMSPLVVPPSPQGPRRPSTLAALPPPPASVTQQMVGAVASTSGGLSSMAARRFSSRPGTGSATPAASVPPGLVTTGPTGPLNARVSVTSAVAAKHGQIMQIQSQIDAESSSLKKSGQMLSMFVNRANAAWAEAQQWGTVDTPAVSELEVFTYSEQYRIYQADLVRRLRQGTICLQVFAGEDVLTGTEKRPSSGRPAGAAGASPMPVAPLPPQPPAAEQGKSGAASEPGGGGGKPGSAGPGGRPAKPKSAESKRLGGTVSGEFARRLSRMDSGGSNASGNSTPVGGNSTSGQAGGSNAAAAAAPAMPAGGSNAAAAAAPAMPAAALLNSPRRRAHDLWTADPWDLIDRFRPGIMPQTDRIQGPTLGARILCQLALAVQQLAGPEAMAVMPVLLHINEEQMEEVVQELWSYRFFGLKRENVMLVASPLHTGYRYNHEYKVFEKDFSSGGTAPLGSGYSMLQLTWAGEAFVVGPEGAPEPLNTPALQLLQERKVEWLVARRARDLALLSREAILDVPMLAYCMAIKDRSGAGGLASGGAAASGGRANIVMEVASCDNLVDARALDSFVMQRAGFANGGAGPGQHHPHPHPPGQLPPLSPGAHPHHGAHGHGPGGQHGLHHGISHSSFVSGGASPAPHHTVPESANAVVELRLAELGTPKMIETMNYLRAIRDGQMTVGLGRYLLHVPSLVQLLPNASALRPKLSLHEELVRVSLDLADLTAAPHARTLAVHARLNQGVLQSADDLEKVIPMLQAQDHDVAFRDMLTSNRTEAQGLEFVASQAAGKAGSAQVIVVFVLNNRVSASAVDAAGLVAKPGRDCIHLVTCISNELQKAEAEEVLKLYQKRLLKSMVDTHCEVLVRGVWGLIDVMDNYVSAVDARMVVMGSQHLTSNDFNYIIGSITLSALKRLHVPVMVVTANSRQNCAIGADWEAAANAASGGGKKGSGAAAAAKPAGGGGVRCLTLVENQNYAKNMMGFLCTQLLDGKRGDRLLLAQVQATRHLTRAQAASVRRALDNFNLLATGHGFSVNRVLSLEGHLDEVLTEAVGEHHIQLLAMALPQGTKTLPPVLISTLRSCRGATLVYKEAIGAAPRTPQGGAAAASRAGFGPGSAAAAAAATAATSDKTTA
ncbi:hypothetical protein HYH02_002820 [Chlamydomonas schloesseri]|uniref:Uncharacterized protein n=1 Tax=Chlamydomonas schloesseri TaxID=2026947 RepID=A0A835WSP8_9CHLO|nr:hypothetical protein HYH02_002820 [Chlamydomonas schloesseri]|eukprot:KAG2452583.1 hypothetical protein HYH02_002820 [Chlamydomonas schloesseri]